MVCKEEVGILILLFFFPQEIELKELESLMSNFLHGKISETGQF